MVEPSAGPRPRRTARDDHLLVRRTRRAVAAVLRLKTRSVALRISPTTPRSVTRRYAARCGAGPTGSVRAADDPLAAPLTGTTCTVDALADDPDPASTSATMPRVTGYPRGDGSTSLRMRPHVTPRTVVASQRRTMIPSAIRHSWPGRARQPL